MYAAVVHRYFETVYLEEEELKDALRHVFSEEHFFVGVIERETSKVWIPATTAIGFSRQDAIEELSEVLGREPEEIVTFNQDGDLDAG
jgi:hypothetical protein